MAFKGHIQNGQVVLDDATNLREGEAVTVRPARTRANRKSSSSRRGRAAGGKKNTAPTPLEDFYGIIEDLPADFAAEHDHYIHGTPKRKR